MTRLQIEAVRTWDRRAGQSRVEPQRAGAPSTRTICVFADACRSDFASAYSEDPHQARAFSTEGNSRMTRRFGCHDPSSTWVAPPRARYRPPCFAIEGGASSL